MAPPLVREWLEHEISKSLGLASSRTSIESPSHLVACTPQEALAIFTAIRSMLPVVNVFFELGRQGESINQRGLEAFLLADMVRHTRLPGTQELGSCLDAIDQVFRQIRKDATATLYTVDPRGYCVIAEETQRSIMMIWNEMIATQDLNMPGSQTNMADGSGFHQVTPMSSPVADGAPAADTAHPMAFAANQAQAERPIQGVGEELDRSR
ncbi:hypothetical protein [Rhizobium binxianense]